MMLITIIIQKDVPENQLWWMCDPHVGKNAFNSMVVKSIGSLVQALCSISWSKHCYNGFSQRLSKS